MPESQHVDEDNRLQRLADLSIEIRLKARVQAVDWVGAPANAETSSARRL